MSFETSCSSLAQNVDFPPISDWETAYSNRRAIPDVSQWMARTANSAAHFGATFDGHVDKDVAYGSEPRERLDIFHPNGSAVGTVVFVHGGYWRASTKESHWHFSNGFLLRGWRVAFIEYPLCPQVSIQDIADSIKRAVECIAKKIPDGPLVMSGHSAGGHLVTWLCSELGALNQDVLERINRVVSLSGLHDLRPLVGAPELNTDLRLNLVEASALSPALSRPSGDFELICIAGATELPEFRRQSLLLANIWNGFGLHTRAIELPNENHFTLLDGLLDPRSDITSLVLGPDS